MERTSNQQALPTFKEIDAAAVPGMERDIRMYVAGDCRIIASKGHISVSCEDRYPTWDEMVEIKERLTGTDSTWLMVMPPSSEYVNLHPNCLHIYSKERLRMEWTGLIPPECAT